MSTPILVPLDGSPLAERAVPYAATLARLVDGHVILVRALSRIASSQDAHANLDPIVARLNRDGVAAESLVTHGEPTDAILRAASEKPNSLIIMSTHGRSGLGRWIYGSVADEVLREASSPVMLVSAACDTHWTIDRPFRVLVPLDGSAHAEEALALVRRFHRPDASEIFLTRSINDARSESLLWDGADQDSSVPAIHELYDYLANIAEPLRRDGYVVHHKVSHEAPAAAIARFARESGADLVTMSTHGRHGASRLLLGSVATGTIHRAHIPLLLTRPAVLTSPSKTSALVSAR